MKQRIYGFLLRRILGPYLTKSSLEQLHKSIEIAIIEGKFILKDVELDCDYLTTLLFQKKVDTIHLKKAVAKKLAIYLSLRDGNDNDASSWRSHITNMYKLGCDSNTNEIKNNNSIPKRGGAGVSLHAHIELEGIDVEITPLSPSDRVSFQNRKSINYSKDKTALKADNGKKGFVGSYVEAALNSLRLNLEMRHISFRLYNNTTDFSQLEIPSIGRDWLELKIASFSYTDLLKKTQNLDNPLGNITTTAVMLHKQIKFSDISLDAVSESSQASQTISEIEYDPVNKGMNAEERIHHVNNQIHSSIGKYEGIGIIKMRVSSHSKTNGHNSMKKNQEITHLLHNFEVSLKDSMSIGIDFHNILLLSKTITVLQKSTVYGNESKRELSKNEIYENQDKNISEGLLDDKVDKIEFIVSEDDNLDEFENELGLLQNIVRNYDGKTIKSKNPDYSDINALNGAMNETFFDANDQGFSFYQSKLSSLQASTVNDDGIVHTDISFFLLKADIRIFTYFKDPMSAVSDKDDFTAITIKDFELASTISLANTTITSSISSFSIKDHKASPSDYLSRKKANMSPPYLLYFIEDTIQGKHNISVLDSGRCLYLQMTFSKRKKENLLDVSSCINISLQPFEIVYNKSSIDNFLHFFKKIKEIRPHADFEPNERHATNNNLFSLRLTVKIETVSLIIPFENSNIFDISNGTVNKILPLLKRSKIMTSNRPPVSRIIDIGCVFEDLTFCLDQNNSDKRQGVSDNASDITTTFERSLVFIRSPHEGISTSDENICYAKILDLFAFSGETSIDPDALIRMELIFRNIGDLSGKSQKRKKQSNFPYVTQLHSVKATQQYENEDELIESAKGLGGIPFPFSSKPTKKSVRGSDPQATMSSDASKSNMNLNIHVPSISFDASIEELSAFVQIVVLTMPDHGDDIEPKHPSAENKSTYIQKSSKTEEGTSKHSLFSISFKCDQLCATIHNNVIKPKLPTKRVVDNERVFSFMIVFDKFKMHLLLGPFGIKNSRCLSHDITLYEVENEPHIFESGSTSLSNISEESIIQRSKLLRKRYHRHLKTNSNVIFFRSKLSHPLSPDTPSFLLDILINKENLDDSHERAIHLSIYDMTYRYDVNSCWIEQLLQLVNNFSVLFDQGGDKECSVVIDNCEDSISVSNLFVTVSDCGVDFVSPKSFKRACRTIIRLSEVRMSSNLVVPSGLIQTFKLSFADVSLYLSNYRVPYNVENQRLSCSKIILGQSDLCSHTEYAWTELYESSIDDALQKMGFVNIASIDWIDTGVSLETVFYDGNILSEGHQLVTATVSAGQTCLSTCHDSFACLTDMIGEIMLKLLMPSKDQVRTFRENTKTPRPKFESLNFSSDSESFSERIGCEISKTLADALEIDIIGGIEESVKMQDDTKEAATSIQPKNGSNNQEDALDDIPDSELSASELRKKYQIRSKQMGKETVTSSLINNYYIDPKNTDGSNNDEQFSKFPAEYQSLSHSTYDWTTVDHEWSRNPEIPKGEEESAFWYCESNKDMDYLHDAPNHEHCNENSYEIAEKDRGAMNLQIFPEHIPVIPMSDPLSGGDMNASKYAGTETAPKVKFRLLVKDISLNCRFYDGFDWANSSTYKSNGDGNERIFDDFETPQLLVPSSSKNNNKKLSALRSFKRRAKIMGSLVDNSLLDGRIKKSFKSVPKQGQAFGSNRSRTLLRQNNKYFQLALSGLKMRLDSFSETTEHILASCMDLSVFDIFLAETISSGTPVKMLGEWFNEAEHPRDSHDGLLMMKMVSMHPKTKISADGKLMSDESKVTLELLPLRCVLHQSAIQYIRKFFSREHEGDRDCDNTDFITPAEAFFQQVKVMPCKLKVDYIPLKVDTNALRDGAYVELINLLPLEEMMLTLNGLEMENLTGWGTIMGEIACRWIEDICATQLHKFITNSSPFKPFSHVGAGAANMVIIPLEEVKCNGPVVSAIRKGTALFAGVLAFETLTTTAKLTKFAAKKLNSLSIYKRFNSLEGYSSAQPATPRNMNAAARPAIESLSRGLREANAKFIIIPYREYQRTGTSGAVRSVIKGLPVAICAPLSGASEALSYTLIGFRNQMYPSVYEEEEANLRGLSTDL